MPKPMINTEPMSISNPAVENKPTPDFAEREISERRTKKVAIIANTQRIRRVAKIPARKVPMASKVMLDTSGVKPESAVQSPFQPG